MAESARDLSSFSWRTSSYSTQGGGNCVEAGQSTESTRVVVRDTKSREHGHLTVPASVWAIFVRSVVR